MSSVFQNAWQRFLSPTGTGGLEIGLPRLETVSRMSGGRKALLIVLLWTFYGIFQSLADWFSVPNWWTFTGKMIEAWVWAMLTPLILSLDRRLTKATSNILHLSLAHVALLLPFSVAHTYLTAVFEYPIHQIWWSPFRNRDYVTFYIFGGFMTYGAFVAILQALKLNNRVMSSQLELAQVEKRLVESRLYALRLQLEPHFIFNALNTISSEIVASPTVAREMIEDLGALLRRSLDCQDTHEITLASELALLDHYSAIQKLRFGKRINIEVDVDPAALAARVPSLLLQPLVENAIRHGIEPNLHGGTVKISAAPVGDQLAIDVIDDGVGLPPRWKMENCRGLGLRVTHERLEALYAGSEQFSFSISRRRGGGTSVAIRMPFETLRGETVGSAV